MLIIDVDAPQSGRGVLLVLGAIALVIVAIFATSLGTIALAAVLIGITMYVLWVLFGRLHDKLRHGKPLIRSRPRPESGGDGDSGQSGHGRQGGRSDGN